MHEIKQNETTSVSSRRNCPTPTKIYHIRTIKNKEILNRNDTLIIFRLFKS